MTKIITALVVVVVPSPLSSSFFASFRTSGVVSVRGLERVVLLKLAHVAAPQHWLMPLSGQPPQSTTGVAMFAQLSTHEASHFRPVETAPVDAFDAPEVRGTVCQVEAVGPHLSTSLQPGSAGEHLCVPSYGQSAHTTQGSLSSAMVPQSLAAHWASHLVFAVCAAATRAAPAGGGGGAVMFAPIISPSAAAGVAVAPGTPGPGVHTALTCSTP